MLICGLEVLRLKQQHNMSWDKAVEYYKQQKMLEQHKLNN